MVVIEKKHNLLKCLLDQFLFRHDQFNSFLYGITNSISRPTRKYIILFKENVVVAFMCLLRVHPNKD